MTTPMLPERCMSCAHNQYFRPGLDKMYCAAFPDGIPDDILNEEFDHIKKHKGDHGILFKERSDLAESEGAEPELEPST